MPIDFKSPLIITGQPPQLERVVWRSLPQEHRDLYRPNKPLFRLTAPIKVFWREWRVEAFPGLITDLASIPWLVHPFGFTRNNRSNWLDLGAILHDGVYYGSAKFTEHSRENRRMADAMMVDLWRAVGGKRIRPWLKHKAVRAFGWWPYNPDPAMNNGEWMRITKITEEAV